jgi:hypothetical protein
LPKAFLRENVQNAYDAILMRCTAQGLSVSERKIEITVEQTRLTVRDDGKASMYDFVNIFTEYAKGLPDGQKIDVETKAGRSRIG